MTMYIMALYATFGIGASLAKSYNLDQVSGGFWLRLLLLTLVPVAIPEEASKAAGVSGFVYQWLIWVVQGCLSGL